MHRNALLGYMAFNCGRDPEAQRDFVLIIMIYTMRKAEQG